MLQKRSSTSTVGLIFGKFYPLHLGHLFLIEKALAQVDELHIMIGHDAERDAQLFSLSKLPKAPTVQDRQHWLTTLFRGQSNVTIHTLDEEGIAFYPNGWEDWSDRVKAQLERDHIHPTTIFTSEAQDAELHRLHFGCDVILVDTQRDFMPISATKIRANPYAHWRFMPAIVQSFFSLSIAIQAISSTERIVAQQLAHLFNTELVTQRSSSFTSDVSYHVNPFYLYLLNELESDSNYFDNVVSFTKGSHLSLLEQGLSALRPFSIYTAL